MNELLIFFVLLIAGVIILINVAGKVYSITVSDFKTLFHGMNENRLINVSAKGPHIIFHYQIYPIDTIPCYDKKGNAISLKNSPAVEIRFYDRNNKKTSFYFDTIRVDGTLIKGGQSRYIASRQKTVDLDAVTKIELRKVKKGLQYIGDPFSP